MSGQEPKIFVDEDWKTQVQREKQQAQQQPVAEAPADAPGDAAGPEEGEDTPFNMLVGTLATQAMFALGLIAPEGVREVRVDLQQAEISILFLKNLQEKTKGNLTPSEQENLDTAAQELEGALVARIDQLQQQSIKESGIDLNNLKNPQ